MIVATVSVFVGCSVAGVLMRKRPQVHRVLMLTASVSLLLGATSRIPWLNDLFGGYVPAGYFGDEYRLIGKLGGEPPFTGKLIHKGWKTESVKLPRIVQTNDKRLPVIAPAEVEVK